MIGTTHRRSYFFAVIISAAFLLLTVLIAAPPGFTHGGKLRRDSLTGARDILPMCLLPCKLCKRLRNSIINFYGAASFPEAGRLISLGLRSRTETSEGDKRSWFRFSAPQKNRRRCTFSSQQMAGMPAPILPANRFHRAVVKMI
jgi:hypothetical protein